MSLCSSRTHNIQRQSKWVVPANNTEWICSKSGLTPYLSRDILNETVEYCVQIMITPRIIYHPEEYVCNYQMTPSHYIQQRELFTALIVTAMMIMGGVGAGTGVTSLVNQYQEFGVLRKAVDKDLA